MQTDRHPDSIHKKNQKDNPRVKAIFHQLKVGQYSQADVFTSPATLPLTPGLSVAFPCYSLWLTPVALWHTPFNFLQLCQYEAFPIDALNTSVQW